MNFLETLRCQSSDWPQLQQAKWRQHRAFSVNCEKYLSMPLSAFFRVFLHFLSSASSSISVLLIPRKTILLRSLPFYKTHKFSHCLSQFLFELFLFPRNLIENSLFFIRASLSLLVEIFHSFGHFFRKTQANETDSG